MALVDTHVLPFVVLFPQLVIYQLQLLLAGPAVRLHCGLLLTPHVKHTRAPECRQSREKWTGIRTCHESARSGRCCRAGAPPRLENLPFSLNNLRQLRDGSLFLQPVASMPAPPPLLLQQKPKCDHLCLQCWLHQVNIIFYVGDKICFKKI